MDEFKFVLKCFIFATALLVFMQIKAGDHTIEGHIQANLVNTKVSDFVNKVADGGVKIIKDAGHYTSETYVNWRQGENLKHQSESPKLNNAVEKIKASQKAELSLDEVAEYIEEE